MNMNTFQTLFKEGVRFVRMNPQIMYTLFLIVIIPVGFLFSSNKFFQVAKENQDALEQSRIGLLQDVFVLFAVEKINDPQFLEKHIQDIGNKNPSMTTFEVLQKQNDGTYRIIASLNNEMTGQTLTFDPFSASLLDFAKGNINDSYAAEFFLNDVRYWRSVRAIPDITTDQTLGYVLTDMSMGQFDADQKDSILGAYLMLAFIIILIILLLARQARILDYATLYQRLKEVDTMKDDFVSMAAHELRSPLMIIRGYADELKTIDNIDMRGLQYIGNIEIAANQLNALVADILDVAKLQDGCLSFNFEQVEDRKSVV